MVTLCLEPEVERVRMRGKRELLHVRGNFKRTQGKQINIGYTLQPLDITATA